MEFSFPKPRRLEVASHAQDDGVDERDYPRWIVPAYVAVLILSFSPFKSLAYALPLLFLAWGMLLGRLRWKALRRPLLIVVGLSLISLVHWALYPDFLWVNAALAILTYSAILVLFADFSEVVSRRLLRRLFRVTLWVLAFQACYGIVQATYSAIVVGGGSFDISVGDAVKGTINPILVGDGAGSNQMFAILMSLSLIAVYPSRHELLSRRERFWLPIIALSWILASVMHTVIFAIGAILVGVILSPLGGKRRWLGHVAYRGRFVLYGALVVGVVFVLLRVFLPANLRTFPHLVERTLTSFRQVQPVSPKVLATLNTFTALPREESVQPVAGLGIGQYSSRAGLIMSGTYLSGGFFLGPASRKVSNELIYTLQESIRDQNVGSTFFPYYSWLSVYGELGVIGILFVVGVAMVVLSRVRRVQRIPDVPRYVVTLAQSVTVAVLFLLLLGLQDNYWEFTQAIFAPLVLLKLSYDHVTSRVSAA